MSAHRKKGGFLGFLLVLLALVCAAGIGYSGYRIYAIRAEYKRGEDAYEGIRRLVNHEPDAGATAAPGETARPNATAASARDGSALDFAPLWDVNADAVGWVSIPDTKIDYPVVQGKDNVFYLDHLFTGEYGSVGSIFMERTNAADFSDQNTILFGHHMKNGSMFAGIDLYKSQEYYEAHPVMTLYTPEGDCEVEIFAGYAIPAQMLPTSFESQDEFLKYVEGARAQSNFTSGVAVAAGDRILTLCTCSYVSDDARYILMGVLR